MWSMTSSLYDWFRLSGKIFKDHVRANPLYNQNRKHQSVIENGWKRSMGLSLSHVLLRRHTVSQGPPFKVPPVAVFKNAMIAALVVHAGEWSNYMYGPYGPYGLYGPYGPLRALRALTDRTGPLRAPYGHSGTHGPLATVPETDFTWILPGFFRYWNFAIRGWSHFSFPPHYWP